MKTIVLIEDHAMMRRGLAAYFAKKKRWKVIGEASDLDEAAAFFKVPRSLPDIVLLDIELKGRWGLDLISQLKERYGKNAPPVLIYSGHEDYAHIKASIRAGSVGFVGKSQPSLELETAMWTVISGESNFYIKSDLFPILSAADDIMLVLTKREREIFLMVQRRRSNQEIAVELGLSIRTIENHLGSIYDKTGVQSRRELEQL
jgi:DNA-binding NarL/FixJ family response regulator